MGASKFHKLTFLPLSTYLSVYILIIFTNICNVLLCERTELQIYNLIKDSEYSHLVARKGSWINIKTHAKPIIGTHFNSI